MTLIALGINHNTADLDVREKLAFSPAQIEPALKDALVSQGFEEIAILSTCNRTELYCHTRLEVSAILEWLSELKGVDQASIDASHYVHLDEHAARHMMKVASGLDSLVLGEPQILGQMKSAYALAKDYGALGGTLHRAFQSVFSVAKQVRSETAIGENPVSVAYAAVSLAQQIFSNLKDDTALLIGAGETIELVARHLVDQGIKRVIVANRTLDNALVLAEKLSREKSGQAEAILLADIPDYLHLADIVITSTASQLPLLGKGAVEAALKQRKHKPVFMVDIAVPRDIEPQVGDLADVFLYTVDDLKSVIDESKRSREDAAEIAKDIIDVAVTRYVEDFRSLSAVDSIKQFRQSIEQIKHQELEKSVKQLSNGADPEAVIEALARNLANKFMHQPTTTLKKAGAEGKHDVLEIFNAIFELSPGAEAKEGKGSDGYAKTRQGETDSVK